MFGVFNYFFLKQLNIINYNNGYSFIRISPFSAECQKLNTTGKNYVPLGAITLFATARPEYREAMSTMIATANQVYNEFLRSDEGNGFNGQVMWCTFVDILD